MKLCPPWYISKSDDIWEFTVALFPKSPQLNPCWAPAAEGKVWSPVSKGELHFKAIPSKQNTLSNFKQHHQLPQNTPWAEADKHLEFQTNSASRC